ncbi:MAG: hypothetical protein ACK4VI_09830 [Alphaproteobacteria bacterium]
MNFKSGIFLTVFALSLLVPALASAMGERPNPQKSRMCETSSATKKFVLTSDNGEIKETFNVPVRYMSMEFERNGRVNNTLHLAAVLASLEPSCHADGSVTSKQETLQVNLSINLRPTEKWGKERYEKYSTDRYEEIKIDTYPNATFKALKKRPSAVEQGTGGYGYIQASPPNTASLPIFLECELLTDMKTLNMCRMRFLYSAHIAVTAMFHATNLENVEQIYSASNALIKKFHVE